MLLKIMGEKKRGRKQKPAFTDKDAIKERSKSQKEMQITSERFLTSGRIVSQ